MESENWVRDSVRNNEKPLITGEHRNLNANLDSRATARLELQDLESNWK